MVRLIFAIPIKDDEHKRKIKENINKNGFPDFGRGSNFIDYRDKKGTRYRFSFIKIEDGRRFFGTQVASFEQTVMVPIKEITRMVGVLDTIFLRLGVRGQAELLISPKGVSDGSKSKRDP